MPWLLQVLIRLASAAPAISSEQSLLTTVWGSQYVGVILVFERLSFTENSLPQFWYKLKTPIIIKNLNKRLRLAINEYFLMATPRKYQK